MQEQLIFILEVEHHARDVFSLKKTKQKKHVQHMLLRRSIWLRNTEQSQEITKLNVSALQVLPSHPTNIYSCLFPSLSALVSSP